MTKGDLLQSLVTEKKRKTNTINKIGVVYVVMFVFLFLLYFPWLYFPVVGACNRRAVLLPDW